VKISFTGRTASRLERRRRVRRHVAAAALAILSFGGLGACSSMGDNLPAPIGLPQGAPERPATEREFLPVHEMPPARDTKPLSEAERKQLETDLKEVRDRQERHVGKPASKASPEKSARKRPAEKSSAEGRAGTKSSD
jgi:hypothetical protein